MNMRQSLKASSKRIEQLEDWNNRARHDIKAYNACIDSVIAGKSSFCDWCEEKRLGDCEKEDGPCSTWWLTSEPVFDIAEGEDADESTGFLQASPAGGEGT